MMSNSFIFPMLLNVKVYKDYEKDVYKDVKQYSYVGNIEKKTVHIMMRKTINYINAAAIYRNYALVISWRLSIHPAIQFMMRFKRY